MPTRKEAKPLPGWLIAKQVAEILGLSRQSVYNHMDAGHFQSLHVIGDNPTFVISADEVYEMKHGRDLANRKNEQDDS